MTKILLGIDLGTSSVKVVAIDTHGRRVADGSIPYPIDTDGASAEQDAEIWWSALCQVAPGVVRGADVAAVAVTSQAPTFVPVDADGTPTSKALTWLDRRATKEATRIAEVVPHSRNGADPFFGTAKLLWLAMHRSAALDHTEAVFSTNGFIVRRLTGVSTLDDTTASLMQGFDNEAGEFDDRLLAAEPSLRYLPKVVPASSVVGRVTASAASATGIPQGTPVVAGGIDAIGSALEAGAIEPGDPLVDMTGFSSVTILPVPSGTRVPGFIHARHCIPGVDLLITAQVTAGATIDWVNSLGTQHDLRDDDVILNRQRPGRLTFVPSLGGERTPSWDINARGIIDGVDLATDGFDLMLAAMEGSSLAMAEDLAVLRARGFDVDHVVSTGGGARSSAWLQIKSDILGVPALRPAGGHGAAQGAAALAGLAVGIFTSAAELRSLASDIDARFEPDHSKAERYRAASARYREVAALNRSRR